MCICCMFLQSTNNIVYLMHLNNIIINVMQLLWMCVWKCLATNIIVKDILTMVLAMGCTVYVSYTKG